MAGRLLCLAEEGPGQVPVLAGPSLSPTAHGRGRLAPVCPGGDAAREERDGAINIGAPPLLGRLSGARRWR